MYLLKSVSAWPWCHKRPEPPSAYTDTAGQTEEPDSSASPGRLSSAQLPDKNRQVQIRIVVHSQLNLQSDRKGDAAVRSIPFILSSHSCSRQTWMHSLYSPEMKCSSPAPTKFHGLLMFNGLSLYFALYFCRQPTCPLVPKSGTFILK